MSSYYNNIPIEEYVNIEYANIDTINASTVKTQNLYIDNIKSSNKVITQNLTLDTDNIESLSKASTAPYTSDNNKITSKGYVDEALNTFTPDLSTCVKNNENQTLTNKFIMSNTSNEININKLKIKDFDNNNTIDTIEKIKTGGSSDNDTLTTKGYIDTNFLLKNNSVGQNYYVSDVLKGEVFNDYINNKASGDCSHAEGYYTKATGDRSHSQGEFTTADQYCQTVVGRFNTLNNTDALFSVGNGNGIIEPNLRSDAFVVYQDGNVKIPTKLTINSSKTITNTTAASNSTQADDAILATKYYIDNLFYSTSNIKKALIDFYISYLNSSDVWITNQYMIPGIVYYDGWAVFINCQIDLPHVNYGEQASSCRVRLDKIYLDGTFYYSPAKFSHLRYDTPGPLNCYYYLDDNNILSINMGFRTSTDWEYLYFFFTEKDWSRTESIGLDARWRITFNNCKFRKAT